MNSKKTIRWESVVHTTLKNAKGLLLLGFAVILLFCLMGAGEGEKGTLFITLFVVLGVAAVAAFVLDKTFYARWEAYKHANNAKVGSDAPSFFGYVMLIIFTLVTLLPFYVIFINSIKLSGEANGVAFTWWPKLGVQFDSYKEVYTNDVYFITMIEALGNTMLYSVAPTVICIFFSALSAYGFAKLDFPCKNFLFSFILFTIMLPTSVSMSSSYMIFDTVGLTDTPWPFILPSLFGSVGTVFFLREYFMGVPDEILESARMDGANKMLVFVKIMLPLCMPAVLAQTILCFIGSYNNYMGPLIYLQTPTDYPLQLFLSFFCNGNQVPDISILCAACVLAMLPLLLVYLLLQKQILSGIVMSSGLKG